MIRRPEIMLFASVRMKASDLLSIFACAAVQGVALATPVQAQPYVNQAQAHPDESPKAYCTRLTSFYDWYGASRSENTDGARNMARIGAGIDCAQGRYLDGIATMETLLVNKKFAPAPAPSAVAQARQFGQNPLPGPERAAE